MSRGVRYITEDLEGEIIAVKKQYYWNKCILLGASCVLSSGLSITGLGLEFLGIISIPDW